MSLCLCVHVYLRVHVCVCVCVCLVSRKGLRDISMVNSSSGAAVEAMSF